MNLLQRRHEPIGLHTWCQDLRTYARQPRPNFFNRSAFALNPAAASGNAECCRMNACHAMGVPGSDVMLPPWTCAGEKAVILAVREALFRMQHRKIKSIRAASAARIMVATSATAVIRNQSRKKRLDRARQRPLACSTAIAQEQSNPQTESTACLFGDGAGIDPGLSASVYRSTPCRRRADAEP